MLKNNTDYDPTLGAFDSDGNFIAHLADPAHSHDPDRMPFDPDSSPWETEINRHQRKLIHISHSVNHAFIVQKLIRAGYLALLPGAFTADQASKATHTQLDTMRRVLDKTPFVQHVTNRRMNGSKKPSKIYAMLSWRHAIAFLLPLAQTYHYDHLKKHHPNSRWMNAGVWNGLGYRFGVEMNALWHGLQLNRPVMLNLNDGLNAYLRNYLIRNSRDEAVYSFELQLRTGMKRKQIATAIVRAGLKWEKDDTETAITLPTLDRPNLFGERKELHWNVLLSRATAIAEVRRPDLAKIYIFPTKKEDNKQGFKFVVPRRLLDSTTDKTANLPL